MAKALPKRLTVHRFVVRRAHNRARAAYVAGAKQAYASGWSVLKEALKHVPVHELAKAAGDPGDDHVIAQVKSVMTQQLESAAGDAAAHLVAGEAEWFATQKLAWTPVAKADLVAAYRQSFDAIGGFKGIADSATEPIQGILADYYTDPGAGLPDLTNALSGYFAGWKAEQVGITETTRMGAANADLVAQRVGADRWEWDSSEDDIVCSECVGLDTQTFSMDDAQESPPVHPGCRCSKAILIEDDEPAEAPAMPVPDDGGDA